MTARRSNHVHRLQAAFPQTRFPQSPLSQQLAYGLTDSMPQARARTWLQPPVSSILEPMARAGQFLDTTRPCESRSNELTTRAIRSRIYIKQLTFLSPTEVRTVFHDELCVVACILMRSVARVRATFWPLATPLNRGTVPA